MRTLRLERLILAENDIRDIPSPSITDASLPWKYLSLVSTGVRDWATIDALARWCPALEGLSVFGTPLIEGTHLVVMLSFAVQCLTRWSRRAG